MSEQAGPGVAVVVRGWLLVRPEDRERYLETCRSVVEQGRAAPGCLDFAISPDLLDPARINVVEAWASQRDLEAFRGAGTPGEQMAVLVGAEVAEHDVAVTRSLT